MGPSTAIAVYLTIWWVVFLGILPIGVTSHADAGIDKGDGGDPGAPVDPKLKQKAITTSWISAIIFAVVWCLFAFHIIVFPALHGGE